MVVLTDDALARLRQAAELPDLTGTRYRVLGKLGQGGMGSVYLVGDAELLRDAALKVLSAPDPTGDLAARLRREAQLLARLEHPGIVPVHDAGTLPDGRVFYVMKHVRGARLDAWARQGQSLPARLRLFQKVCGAVAFAHAQGVIHRDLKPDNIMVGEFGEAVVMDWGVAKLLQGAAPTDATSAENTPTRPPMMQAAATRHGAVVGTPEWMSPEQSRGETSGLDERSDVWALGAILKFLLEGTGIPKPVESICRKALAQHPEDRYRTAAEMSGEVDAFLDGLPVTAHRETLSERAGRLLRANMALPLKALVLMMVAYLIMRALVALLAGL